MLARFLTRASLSCAANTMPTMRKANEINELQRCECVWLGACCKLLISFSIPGVGMVLDSNT